MNCQVARQSANSRSSKHPSPFLPLLLREVLDESGLADVETWWADLDTSAQIDILDLWSDCASYGGRVRLQVEIHPVETGNEYADQFWNADFYEFLVNHEAYLEREKKVHICTRHAAARTAVQSGAILPDFSCPLENRDCPMRRVLSVCSGKQVRLSLAFRPLNEK